MTQTHRRVLGSATPKIKCRVIMTFDLVIIVKTKRTAHMLKEDSL